ncbi:MAG TPA: hypothetical protein VKO20_10125 [Desulfosalsimonadaceae bacterium]|nr:hypothetical protein [Desulfosalsimonadaceae bacterium]
MTDANTPNDEEYERIAGIENAIEGQLLGSILQEQEIPHRIRSFHDTAYDGMYQFQKGWGAVFAPEHYRASILDILDKIRSDAEATD